MAKKKKTPRDVNQLAKSVVDQATGSQESEQQIVEAENTERQKNEAAVLLGRLGGKKGGPARARKLSEERRREIARKAAAARWGTKKL